MSNVMNRMNIGTVRIAIASAVLALLAAFSAPAFAQSETLSTTVARELTKAFEIIQAKEEPTEDDLRQAVAIIEALLASRSDRMSPYELGTSYELVGSYKFQLGDYNGALRAFEQAVNSGGLPEARATQIRYNIAQLYFQEERYSEAIRYIREFINYQQANGVPVNANTWYLLAAANVATENYAGARQPMETALRQHEQEVANGSTSRKKSYYDLLNAIYSQIGADSERGDLLVRMINFFPSEASYWEQLSGSYSAAGRDSDAAAVLELAYQNGLIDDADKIVALVQYYSLLGNPFRGGKLLEREMAAGNVPRNLKNLELLAQMWNLAREQKKAAEVLEEAAQLSDDGELYYRLGQVYFADEQWERAETMLQRALNRGGISGRDRANIWLLIGNARYNIDTNSPSQRARAKEAWRNAVNTGGVSSADRASAQGWIEYVNAVERTECNQDTVERRVRLDNFRKDKASCESIINIVNRAAEGTTGFSVGFSDERIAECRILVDSTIDEETAIITRPDGTTEGEPRPGYCSRFDD